MTIRTFTAAALLGAAAFTAASAQAGEATLKAVTAFATGTTFSRDFETFVDWVNENGEGVLQIDLLGGPEAVPPFELGNAVQAGIVDIANNTTAYYPNLLPAGDALHLAQNTIQDQRANGCYDLIDQVHQDQMGVKYLARVGDHMNYHLYLTKPLEDLGYKVNARALTSGLHAIAIGSDLQGGADPRREGIALGE